MADSKTNYSKAAKSYSRNTGHTSMTDAFRFFKSKSREAKYDANWKKNSVNLNTVVTKFAPGTQGKAKGVKYVFENANYSVKVDMASGYLRIFDKKVGKYIKMNGKPGTNEETHFKVLKRRDM
jgi:hypothetical protein